MFVFDLKKFQFWVVMVLLLLCFSIRSHSSYPHAKDDKYPTEANDNVDNEEDWELVQDEGEEEHTMAEIDGLENEGKKTCVGEGKLCTTDQDCCGSLVCFPSVIRQRCRTGLYASMKTRYYSED